jgi:TM2 domain-containing membrane protein YozV
MLQEPPKFYKNPAIAAVLSFFWSGLGQIYNGQIIKGVVFVVAAAVSAWLMVVGIGFILWPIVWIWGMVDAHSSAKRINAEIAVQ